MKFSKYQQQRKLREQREQRELPALQLRLLSCLETILEIEQELKSLNMTAGLRREFTQIKEFMKKVESIVVSEHDVKRIETVTARFLRELEIPCSRLLKSPVRGKFLQ